MIGTPAIAMLLAACMPDDWNGEPYSGPDGTGAEAAPAFAGSWLSEGADLSDLFAAEPFSYERVEAVFVAGGGYAVTSTAADGATYVLTGTWLADDGAVTLLQITPYEAEAEGIWAVDGDVLTWEVVQTVPDYGFVPPTPSTGFGSTSGPGLEPGANVQIYRRVP